MSLAILTAKQVIKNLEETLEDVNLEQEKENIANIASTAMEILPQLSSLSSERPLETAFTGNPIAAVRYLFEPINIKEEDVIDSIENGFNPDDFPTRNVFVKKLLQHYIFYRNNHIGAELHNCLKDGNIEDLAKLLKKLPKEFIPDLMKVKNADGKTLLEAINLILHDDLSGLGKTSGDSLIIYNTIIGKFKKHLHMIPKEFIPDVMRVKNADGKTLLDIAIYNVIISGWHSGRWNKVVEKIIEKTPVEALSLSAFLRAGKYCNREIGKKILKKMLSDSPKELEEAVSSLFKCLKKEDLTVDQFNKKLSEIPEEVFSLITPGGGYSLWHFVLVTGQLSGGFKLLETNKDLVIEKIPPELCSVKDSDDLTLLSFAIMQHYGALSEEILKKTSPEALTFHEWEEACTLGFIGEDKNPVIDKDTLAFKIFEKMSPNALTIPLAEHDGKSFYELAKESDFESKEILLEKIEQKLAIIFYLKK